MTGAYRVFVGIERCCHRIKNLQNASPTPVYVKNHNFHSAQAITVSSLSGKSGKDKGWQKKKKSNGNDINKIEFGKKGGGSGGKDGRSSSGHGMVCPSCNSPFVQLETFEGYPRFIKCYSCSSLFTQVVEDVKTVITPKEMKGYLDEVVVGQDMAKIALASAAHEHYKRVAHNMANQTTVEMPFTDTDHARFGGPTNLSSRLGAGAFNHDLRQSSSVKPSSSPTSDIKLQKSNILMLGPTGSGKTYLVSTLAKFLDVPFVEFDCTTLTSFGYVGEDVNTPISLLYQEAGCNIEKCQQGIILLDEIDKIAKKHVSMSTKDVGGESVQQALLKILEGTKVEVSSKGTKTNRMESLSKVVVDTTNILFIGAGAFSNLDTHIRKRQNKKYVGFGAPVDSEVIQTPVTNVTDLFSKPSDKEETEAMDEAFRDVQDIDIIKYGFLPEFVGRMCKLVVTHSLSEEALRKILTEPKNAFIKQYQCIFGFEKCDLQFTEAALLAIVKNAIKKKTGARGLKAEIDKLLFMPLYDVPGSDITTVIIDEDCITKNAAPVYKRENFDTIDCTVGDSESTSQNDSENGESSRQKNLVLKKSFSLPTEPTGSVTPDRIDK